MTFWLAAMPVVMAQQGSQAAGKVSQSSSPTGGNSGQETLDSTDEVVRDVLETLQQGFENHNATQAMSVFDADRMENYAQVRDDIRAFFNRYAVVHFRYKVLQVTPETDGGWATAEIDMDATPTDETLMPVRRSTQMRFQLRSTPKGWKIVSFAPSDFFVE